MRYIANRSETWTSKGSQLMQSTTDKKGEKALFVAANVALAIVWMRFLFRLIARWKAMGPNNRVSIGLFMMFFSLLWLMLIREKRGFIAILMAGGVFMTVYEIVKSFM